MLVLSAILSLALSVGAEQKELPGKPPNPDAQAHTPYGWKSLNNLRFVWWLPEKYDRNVPRNLTVVCHPARADYRWGFWNLKPESFRKDDVVVSVDGPTEQRDDRLFSLDKKDAASFDAFLGEMRRTFAVDRVFLYGWGEGGVFALAFAGDHADSIAGTVAHASGDWVGFAPGGEAKKVAVALLHGSADAEAPFSVALERREAYAKAGWPLVLLRRLDLTGHEINGARAEEALAWCQGMTATKPEEALACALEILRPPPRDPQDSETKVGFSGAREILRRLEKKGPAPFADVPEAVASEAQKWASEIEALGAKHVAALRPQLKSNKIPKLDPKVESGAWLGHLVPLRTDFRGVESVESYLKELGYDAIAAAHEKAGRAISEMWSRERDPKKLFGAVVDGIGKAYFYDGFPADLLEKMKEWRADTRKYAIPAGAEKKYAELETWQRWSEEGHRAYLAICQEWKGP
jgi:predicted esterase